MEQPDNDLRGNDNCAELLKIWFNRDETARILAVTVRTVDRLRKKGRLEDLDPFGAVRISRSSIEQYLCRQIICTVPSTLIVPVPADNYNALILELHHYNTEAKRLGTLEQKVDATITEKSAKEINPFIAQVRGMFSKMYCILVRSRK
jgi:hypothetical protein